MLPEILANLAGHPRLVLEAPPGAGKTTQVPLALLQAGWCTGKILMLEPRRLAARGAAAFMAAQLGEPVGATVGYQIRFERRTSTATRIEILTEGILTRRLQEDPALEGVSAVLFDEFHERHLSGDLGLALCLDIQTALRPDLRLLVMSATLDGAKLARFLDAPRVTAEGRSFPVSVRHVPLRPQEPEAAQWQRAVRLALDESPGDILFFLPGKAEIDRAARALAGVGVALEILHGELGMEAQAKLLASAPGRRLILATNIAESSLTLPGVTAVIDSGLAREPRFDPGSGMSRLETVFIPQASATQRAGRAGRTAPGLCLRLWPESQRLEPGTRPELQRVDLAGFLLELAAWGNEQVALPDPPPPGSLAQARDLLRELGALDAAGRITAHGRRLMSLGVHPRLGNAMLKAPLALQGLACDIVALLEGRDPLRGEARREEALRPRLLALQSFRRTGRADGASDRGALAQIDQAARAWRQRLRATLERETGEAPEAHTLGQILAQAYPDRIAKRDEANASRYLLAGGKGAQLAQQSSLQGEPWLVIADLRQSARDSLILRAAPLSPEILDEIFPERFRRTRSLAFNPGTGAVECREETRFAELLLASRQLPAPRDAETARQLLQGISTLGLDALPWSDKARALVARVGFLRKACPELGLPDFSETALLATLEEWLAPMLEGSARLSELSAGQLELALVNQLDHAQRRALETHAPQDLLVPSGQRRALAYAEGEAPVLAVKLQELFGLADTPQVAMGRVPVVLHLLSPRQIPIQVTRDLRSFWTRTYPEVRKELKGRYPRHPWPEDPWTAPATHRAKPRGT